MLYVLLGPFIFGVNEKLFIVHNLLVRLHGLHFGLNFGLLSLEELLFHFQFTLKLLLLFLFSSFVLVAFVFEFEEVLGSIQLVHYTLSRGELVT